MQVKEVGINFEGQPKIYSFDSAGPADPDSMFSIPYLPYL